MTTPVSYILRFSKIFVVQVLCEREYNTKTSFYLRSMSNLVIHIWSKLIHIRSPIRSLVLYINYLYFFGNNNLLPIYTLVSGIGIAYSFDLLPFQKEKKRMSQIKSPQKTPPDTLLYNHSPFFNLTKRKKKLLRTIQPQAILTLLSKPKHTNKKDIITIIITVFGINKYK